ncbi:tRNA (adenine(58)-N(1))-methyltransferase non-catalytic subunit TRM6 [Leguminivora glycinivorella]|uniref:tRNA (adenine(58)-N(1))-methyltransferase non-catalytic subunit TRM6 n=1 Tax=Leguminivora glycinivorella TaxID=1035111 RepID=UPI00200BDF8D|nr:tRNA (adenine(58)-N(1))-methyltransferase non-catalytic subunit TRM6 [Leguminivora glycinivorella]
MTPDNTIRVGEYIVIQKQNYRKLHKFNKADSCINIGRDSVNLTGIEGCRFHSVFKLIPKGGKRTKEFSVQLTEEAGDLKDEINVKTSGTDNRNIFDDGQSQKLSYSEIEELRNDAKKASDIVETLISNSNTFSNKTEFSQEKYLRKKEKKYFEYIQILKPNLRMISEIMYKLEPGKIQNIRIDTLSQIITAVNIQSEGVHLLYDSGSNGLLAAALLSAIGESNDGKLIHMHPGNMSQKQALLAMNYKEEQLGRCISVNIYSVLRQYYQGCDTHDTNEKTEHNNLKRKAEESPAEIESKIPKLEEKSQPDTEEKIVDNSEVKENDKPKEFKKPKWHFDNINAAELLKGKVDSLVIACKEDPQNLFDELVNFVKPGRPFAIYYTVAEPLQKMYMNLKIRSNVAALKLTCNWMRNYQVLPDRTHPEVMMNGASGFILTGYVLK